MTPNPTRSGGHPSVGDPLFAVGVVIPVRDEAARIARTIRSVRRSISRSNAVEASIVVVADSCTDRSVAVARRELGSDGLVLEVAHSNVGAARAEGSTAVLHRLGEPPRWTWLLGIDGDSEAPADWVQHHLAHAAQGVECVTGIVDLDLGAGPALRRRFQESYGRAVGADHHHHVHGTNFGIRGDTLLEVGNWPRLATGEDHALWSAVGALDRRIVQDPKIVVTTSSRLRGRAPAGFAVDLSRLDEDDVPTLAASALV